MSIYRKFYWYALHVLHFSRLGSDHLKVHSFHSRSGCLLEGMRAACQWNHGKSSGAPWLEFEHLPSVLVLEAGYLEYDSTRDTMIMVSVASHMVKS